MALTEEKETEKLFYAIGEVAEMFEVNTSLIRFWEKEFDIISPSKNKKGNRLFTKKDIENFKLIFYFVKEKGYTLQGAKDKLKSGVKESDQVKVEVIAKLKNIKEQLLKLKDEL
jgi:DNA-binding transcriptional MerR regulator